MVKYYKPATFFNISKNLIDWLIIMLQSTTALVVLSTLLSMMVSQTIRDPSLLVNDGSLSANFKWTDSQDPLIAAPPQKCSSFSGSTCNACSSGYVLSQNRCIDYYVYNELNRLNAKIDACCAKTPKVIRIEPYDLCGVISLHQQSLSLTKAIPIPPNKKVFGVLVSFFYTNVASGQYNHGYMSARVKQTGDFSNYVKFISRKFNWYANTANEMEIVPWNTNLINTIDIDISDTYNTPGTNNQYGKNQYECRLVGYLTYE